MSTNQVFDAKRLGQSKDWKENPIALSVPCWPAFHSTPPMTCNYRHSRSHHTALRDPAPFLKTGNIFLAGLRPAIFFFCLICFGRPLYLPSAHWLPIVFGAGNNSGHYPNVLLLPPVRPSSAALQLPWMETRAQGGRAKQIDNKHKRSVPSALPDHPTILDNSAEGPAQQ